MKPKKPLPLWARILRIALLIPFIIISYGFAGYMLANRFGYVAISVNISGTGSMFPTFPKGEGKDPKELAKQIVGTPGMFRYPNGILLFGKRYFNHIIGRGDIVVAENEKINKINEELYEKPGGVVKRVIAIPGDSIEIRDGIVILNGVAQKEPYIARGRSTFGGNFLSDCKSLTIPQGKYFIMGDNRKGSGDSRHDIGLVDEADIKYVLPIAKQKGTLDKNWHDAGGDLEETAKITLNRDEFLKLLNEKRNENKASPLKAEPKLAASAQKRGGVILKYNDFSFEATRSGYKMTRATADSGYYNIIYGEWSILGYYEAQELMDNLFEFPEGKKFLTNKEYDDFGISEVAGTLNGCPSHIVVMHFAGYVPPNYTKDVIDSWRTLFTQLKDVQPGWLQVKTYSGYYEKHKGELDRLNDIILQRIEGVSAIVARMENNQWLTGEQEAYMKRDTALAEEQNKLAERLNSYRN